jgi:hypothetical protein
VKGKVMGEVRHVIWEEEMEKKTIYLEGSQISSTRPSDEGGLKANTLELLGAATWATQYFIP